MVHQITPKTFFAVVRGRGSVDETNLVYEELARPRSELNQWLSAVEKYAEQVFQAKPWAEKVGVSHAKKGRRTSP